MGLGLALLLAIAGAGTAEAASPAALLLGPGRVDAAAVGVKLKTETFSAPAGKFEIQIRDAGVAIVLPNREVMAASRAELERLGYEVTREHLVDLMAPATSRDSVPIETILAVARVRLDDKQLAEFRKFLNGEPAQGFSSVREPSILALK